MVSVNENIRCKVCEYKDAYYEIQLRTNEEKVMCGRCGSSFSSERVYDIERTKLTYKKAKKLLKENKINEAIELIGMKYKKVTYDKKGKPIETKSDDLPDEEKVKEIKVRLNRMKEQNFNYFYKFDKEGNAIFEVIEHKTHRNTIVDNVSGGGSFGGMTGKLSDWKLSMKELIANNKNKIKDIRYTFKNKGKWFIKSIITNETKEFKGMYERIDEEKKEEKK